MIQTLRDKILARMESMGIEPKRSLGQNFLISDHVVLRIIQAAKLPKPSQLIEIGPGLGSLTDELMGIEAPLTLLELDRTFAENWRSQGQTVIEGDALQLDWPRLGFERALLVSNLPYQISSSLVIDRSIEPSGVVRMILMFQKEVAQRLTAKEKTEQYGMLTVIAQTFWRLNTLLEVSPRDFFPAPNVASRVVVFDELATPAGLTDLSGQPAAISRTPGVPGASDGAMTNFPRAEYLRFVKAGFAHRRKLLLKNLLECNSPKIGRPELEAAFAQLKLTPQARAEELSPQQFVRLFLASRAKLG